MKNFDEKAAQEMRVKAYQERERKRLEVSVHTRGFFCDEAWMNRKKRELTKRKIDFYTCRYSSRYVWVAQKVESDILDEKLLHKRHVTANYIKKQKQKQKQNKEIATQKTHYSKLYKKTKT